jgi:hypothetical protein
MADWVVEELRWKFRTYEKWKAISVYDGDIVKSDFAISESLKAALERAASPLEDIPLQDRIHEFV